MCIQKWMCNHLKVNSQPVRRNDKVLLLTLSHCNDIRYEYHRSLWRGPCCWHSCSLGVNAQDAPHCCLSAQQFHINTKTGKIFTHPECETLSEKCSLTCRGKCDEKHDFITQLFLCSCVPVTGLFSSKDKVVSKKSLGFKQFEWKKNHIYKYIEYTLYIFNILSMQLSMLAWFAQYPL